MDERQTFCEAVRRPERNMAALCREYKISRTTGYKWLKRSTDAEAQGLGVRLPWVANRAATDRMYHSGITLA